MADSLITSQTPALTNISEAQPVTVASNLVAEVDGQLTHGQFFASTVVGGTYEYVVWQITADDDPAQTGTGTIVGQETFTPTGGVLNTFALDPPIAVTADTAYRIGVRTSQGRYTATGGFFTSSGLTSGQISSPQNGTNPTGIGLLSNGVFIESITLYPNKTSGTAPFYFVGAVFAPTVEDAEGQAALGLELTLAAVGEAPAVAAAEGQAAWGLELSLAAVGEAPVVMPAEGQAAFSLALSMAGAGVGGEAAPTVRCGWDGIDPTLLGVCDDWTDHPAALRDSAMTLAADFMWGATGRQYGLCPITIRPSQRKCGPDPVYQAYPAQPGDGGGYVGGPFLFAGRWYNAATCSGCCNGSECAIVLPGPVASVTEVVVADEVVLSSAYRVDVSQGTYLLVRQDGECWPSCNGAPGDFDVTYEVGRELPGSLVIATALLACEYGKTLAGGACALPARMTSLTRQGVQVEVASDDPSDGLTGIREIDAVILALNPSRRQYPPVILSPDLPGRYDRMTIWNGA